MCYGTRFEAASTSTMTPQVLGNKAGTASRAGIVGANGLALILAGLAMLGPVLGRYLPAAFPSIQATLHATPNEVQQTPDGLHVRVRGHDAVARRPVRRVRPSQHHTRSRCACSPWRRSPARPCTASSTSGPFAFSRAYRRERESSSAGRSFAICIPARGRLPVPDLSIAPGSPVLAAVTRLVLSCSVGVLQEAAGNVAAGQAAAVQPACAAGKLHGCFHLAVIPAEGGRGGVQLRRPLSLCGGRPGLSDAASRTRPGSIRVAVHTDRRRHFLRRPRGESPGRKSVDLETGGVRLLLRHRRSARRT